MSFELSFGEMEALLANLHGIASDKRIAFQGRLKTILKLGLPSDVKKGRGRAASYGAGEFMLMALYVELSQLGLQPERAVHLVNADDFPVYAAVKRSADMVCSIEWTKYLRREPTSAEPVFLYLDPTTWSPLMPPETDNAAASFAWAGARTVARNLSRVTSNRDHRRLALLNVTALVDEIAALLPSAKQATFLEDVERWARVGTFGQPDRDIVPPWEKQ